MIFLSSIMYDDMTLDEHLDNLASTLITEDKYDEALKYFLENLAHLSALMDACIAPPSEVVKDIRAVFSETLKYVFKTLQFEEEDTQVSVRFFYYPPKNFLHGMLLKDDWQGIIIYFPGMKKGGMLMAKPGLEQANYFRITKLGNAGSTS